MTPKPAQSNRLVKPVWLCKFWRHRTKEFKVVCIWSQISIHFLCGWELLNPTPSPPEQNWSLARTIPLQVPSQTRPDPVRIRAVFGTASPSAFLDYLATRWLWKLTHWSFSSAIFDTSEIDSRLCISGPKIDLSQIFSGFLRMKIGKNFYLKCQK